MVRLQVVVAGDCFGCFEALRLYREVQERLPDVEAELIDLAAEPERQPQEVVAVPSYVVDGRLAFAGNPTFEELSARLRPDTERGIVVYSTSWCPDCRRTKRFLDRYGVPYTWVDIDQDPQAARYVLQVNGGLRRVPTILFPDGSVLVEPSNGELARKLGIQE